MLMKQPATVPVPVKVNATTAEVAFDEPEAADQVGVLRVPE